MEKSIGKKNLDVSPWLTVNRPAVLLLGRRSCNVSHHLERRARVVNGYLHHLERRARVVNGYLQVVETN
jgi:hypothetical protein